MHPSNLWRPCAWRDREISRWWLSACAAFRCFGPRGSDKQMVESGAFLGAKCGEKVVFNQAHSEISNAELVFTCFGYLDDVTSPVYGIAPPDDETGSFELI